MTTALAPLANASAKDMISQWMADDAIRLKDIAAQYSVSKQAICKFLMKHAENDWKDAQVAKALVRKEDAEEELDRATNMVDIARGRERLKAAQWDLERVCRRIYGQDAPPVGAQAVQININMRGQDTTNAAQQVVDAEIGREDQT